MFIVRQARKTDLKKIIDLRLRLIDDYPEAYVVTSQESRAQTPENWEKWLMKYLADPQSSLFLAKEGKKLIGMVAYKGETLVRLKHAGAIIALGVLPAYQRKGAGERLMRKLISWIKRKRDVRRLQLEVFTDNQEAIALYHKLGFKKEGIKRRYTRRKNGRYQDALLMARFF